MINTRLKTTFAILFLFWTTVVNGQQEPMFTQYIFNMQTINPAYAGTWQNIGLMALSRLQWIDFAGHPSTETFSFQSPLNNKDVGIGFNVIVDKVGLEKRLSLNADYSYKIGLSAHTSLRFGIKGGFTNYSNNLKVYEQYPDNLPDAAFETTIENKLMPNFGVGCYLLSDSYYLSLSLPKIIANKYQLTKANFSTSSEARQLYFAGGMMMYVADNIQFKPAFMTKAVFGSPVQFDLSGNFLFAERFWIGAVFRTGDAVGAVAQWIFSRNLRFGYAYDITISEMRNYQRGVHEVMVSYEFAHSKLKLVSPRFF